MKCLHVINDLALGGTQSLALRTMRSLTERGLEVQLCVLGSEEKTYAWPWLPPLQYLSLSTDYRKPWEIRRIVRIVGECIDSHSPELLHSWLWTADYVSALASQRRSVPHLSHIVDRRNWQSSPKLRHRYRRWISQRAFRAAGTKFVAVSEAAKSFAAETLQLRNRDILIAYNSIDVDEFNGIPASPFFSGERKRLVIGMASRMEPEKGHSYLIDALPMIRDAGIDVSVRITGAGGYKSGVELQVGRLRLSNFVKFDGFVDSVSKFLSEIDLFIVPSVDSEGLPTTILESMAVGRPVIATDIGGAREAIRHEVDGLIIPARDSRAIADAVISLAGQKSRVQQLTNSARLRVRASFSSEAMVDAILNRYRELTAGTESHL